MFGVPSGSPFVGSFKVDIHNGVILLDESFSSSYIMLEYISSPNQDEEYYVPSIFREALISWLAWQDISFIPSKTHVNDTNVGMRRRDFYNERRLAIARYKPTRLAEGFEISLESTRLAVKG